MLVGFIIKKRGIREDSKPPAKPELLTNNIILKKLRIALTLRDVDIIEIMSLANVEVSKTELSALFRREGHKNYKECGNQFLRYFLKGLTLKFRPIVSTDSSTSTDTDSIDSTDSSASTDSVD